MRLTVDVTGTDTLAAIQNFGHAAFYAFANVEGAIAKMGLKNDLEFSEVLLNTVGVAVVPGSAFGLDGHMRISYATMLFCKMLLPV